MKIYFARHGESTANLQREFSNRTDRHPLTEAGWAMAQALARRLEQTPVQRIYASPVLRARQTAGVLAETLGVPLEITEALREWDVGIYEGTTDPQGWELHRQVQERWFYHQDYTARMPGGESFLDIEQRFVPFIEGLVVEWGSQPVNLVLVAHGGLYLAMLPRVLANVGWGFAVRQGLTYTGVVVAEARPDGLWCESWCGALPALE